MEHHHHQHHEHEHHHHHEPSNELDHLDRMAELHASDPMILKINKQVVSLLPFAKLANNAHVLDFGCGAGRISLLLAARPDVASVIGVDISEGMINTAKQLTLAGPSDIQAKVSFQVASRLPTKELEPWKGTKDLVVMSLVLGHISPKAAGQSVLETAAATLKPGGQFALAEFLLVEGDMGTSPHPADHHDHPHHIHTHSGRGQHQHPHGDHGSHQHHHVGHVAYTEAEVREIFTNAGLEPADQFTPFKFELGVVSRKCIMAVGTKR